MALVKVEDSGFRADLNYWKVVFEFDHREFSRGGNTKFIALRNAVREWQYWHRRAVTEALS